MIKKSSGFDVVKAVVDLTLGEKPHVEKVCKPENVTINEFVYCHEGRISSLEGFDRLVDEGIAAECTVFNPARTVYGEIRGSGDRLAYFSIVDDNLERLKHKHAIANERIHAYTEDGKDIVRHDLISKFKG